MLEKDPWWVVAAVSVVPRASLKSSWSKEGGDWELDLAAEARREWRTVRSCADSA